MERLTLLLLSFLFLKQITVGSEFNFVKYFKNRKKYLKDYLLWLSKRP